MVKLETTTEHVVIDIDTQSTSRSCIIGGVSLGKYSVAINSGDSLDVGTGLCHQETCMHLCYRTLGGLVIIF